MGLLGHQSCSSRRIQHKRKTQKKEASQRYQNIQKINRISPAVYIYTVYIILTHILEALNLLLRADFFGEGWCRPQIATAHTRQGVCLCHLVHHTRTRTIKHTEYKKHKLDWICETTGRFASIQILFCFDALRMRCMRIGRHGITLYYRQTNGFSIIIIGLLLLRKKSVWFVLFFINTLSSVFVL